MFQYTILLVNNNENLSENIRFHLQNEGFLVHLAYSSNDALREDLTKFDLLIVDVKQTDFSGFKLVHLIRNGERKKNIPIIFLTEKGNENDLLTAYNLGADDYITNPFSLRELTARIKIILFRADSNKSFSSKIISYEQLKMNVMNKQVLLHEKEIQFTRKEFEILKLFLENKNKIFSREELLSRIWAADAFVLSRTIDVNITRIRKKIGLYGQHVVTKLGAGYCFEE
jgi:two-component system phosphate regulon response regulator PhoB